MSLLGRLNVLCPLREVFIVIVLKSYYIKFIIQGTVIAREYSRNEGCTTMAPVGYGGRLEEIYISLHQLLDVKDSQVRYMCAKRHVAGFFGYQIIHVQLAFSVCKSVGSQVPL